MRSGLKRVLAFLLTLTFVSMSMLNSFWAKYAKTFSVTDSLRVAFRRETVVHLPSGREMNTMFNPDTVKIVFGAMPSHLPSTAKLVDPANMSGYTMVPGAGQTNSTIQYVTGVSPVGFDPSDPSNDVYRINPALDDAAVYVFYDNISDTTYFVSRTSGIEYHFNEENEPDLVTGSTVEYNDFFYGLDDLEDIELKTGSSWDTSDVRTFHNFLSGCSSLSTAELAEIISFIDPSSAYSLAAMFEGLPLVTAVNISDWNLSTSEGVDISYMLSGMTSLTSIAFPTGAKKITLLSGNGIKRLFAGDTSLQTLNLSNLPYCATTNDSGTFNGCSSLETIFVARILFIRLSSPRNQHLKAASILSGSRERRLPTSILPTPPPR